MSSLHQPPMLFTRGRTLSDPVNTPPIGIPQLGFGVYQSHGQKCIDAVLEALRIGYRHIDTAQYYGNEKEVGIAIKQFMEETNTKRQDIFITTKILTPEGSYQGSYDKCIRSIIDLDDVYNYVDLFLIHSPNAGVNAFLEMWTALCMLHFEGKARLIGVSNFGIGQIEMLKECRFEGFWPPYVNQIELHPFCQQREIVEYCKREGILIEAYCPLIRNERSEDPVLRGIALVHNKTVAQVLIRYALQKDWIPLPKSETPSRIAENADVFDWSLSEDDMNRIDALDEGSKGSIVQPVNNE